MISTEERLAILSRWLVDEIDKLAVGSPEQVEYIREQVLAPIEEAFRERSLRAIAARDKARFNPVISEE
jgi:hypothetical protein